MVLGTMALFAILSVVFLTTSTILLRALAKHFTKFYLKYRCMLVTVTVLMTVPLAFRAILDGLKAALPGWADWIDSSKLINSVYNFLFFLLTTYLPIVSQMGTLVFAFTRQRELKLKRQRVAHEGAEELIA